jgi:hypothetical protein
LLQPIFSPLLAHIIVQLLTLALFYSILGVPFTLIGPPSHYAVISTYGNSLSDK